MKSALLKLIMPSNKIVSIDSEAQDFNKLIINKKRPYNNIDIIDYIKFLRNYIETYVLSDYFLTFINEHHISAIFTGNIRYLNDTLLNVQNELINLNKPTDIYIYGEIRKNYFLTHLSKTIKDCKEDIKNVLKNELPNNYDYIYEMKLIILNHFISLLEYFLYYNDIVKSIIYPQFNFIEKIFKLFTLTKIKGGKSKSNYKKTENKITVLFNEKKYIRTIYICERKKYVKINKTFMLLSKLKKV
jgi:hypothetical protein